MNLKQAPNDFQVEELTALRAGTEGPHALYRLTKRGWSTPDALAVLRQRWRIDLARLSCGGLKDRHAATVQYLTIHHGPRRGLKHHEITIEYLGQVAAPYTSQEIEANRFHLVLRDLAPADQPRAEARLAEVAAGGVPNYFDDQRFGSVAGKDGEFIARLLVRGRFEEALRLALAGPYEYDRAAQKREKALLNAHWGDWERLERLLPHGHARIQVGYLRNRPGDFRGAVARLRPDLRGLYLSAYQSHLWNRLLARWIEAHCPAANLRPVALRLGIVPFHHDLDAAGQQTLAELVLPLPTARLHLDPADPHAELIRSVLAEEELELRDLQVRGVRELFFSRGERAGLCLPRGLKWEFADDETHRHRCKLALSFDLPRGCYATLVVKAIPRG